MTNLSLTKEEKKRMYILTVQDENCFCSQYRKKERIEKEKEKDRNFNFLRKTKTGSTGGAVLDAEKERVGCIRDTHSTHSTRVLSQSLQEEQARV